MTDSWVVPRIVSLLPSATEIICALGLSDALVGVTHECDYPPVARTKPVLTRSVLESSASASEIDRHVRGRLHGGSSLYALDADRLESLQPDLIVTQELCDVCAVSYDVVARAAKRLRGDPRIVSLEPASLDDVFATIGTIGDLAGVAPRAAALVDGLRARAADLARRTRGGVRPRTLLLEWTDPPFGPGHWSPGLVELAGGEPVLHFAGSEARRIAWTDIAEADPDAIVVAPCGFDVAATERAIAELDVRSAWRNLRAVRSGRAYALDGNAYVSRPGPRLIESAELIACALRHDLDGAARIDPGALRAIAP